MKLYIAISFAVCICFTACTKTSFLNTNPDPSLVVPSSLQDYQAMLDNDFTMNGEAGYGVVPALGECGADDYFITSNFYSTYLTPLYQRVYVWQKDVFDNEQIYDWNIAYQCIDIANTVLDGLAKLNSNNQLSDYNKAKGSALFYRAHLFYQLAQEFAKPYTKDSASAFPGIPLRLTSALTESLTRATLEDTYDQIVKDLQNALVLLPAIPAYATQPAKPACYALLARVYLNMQDYKTALLYADSCIRLKSELIDYNTLDTTSAYPFTAFNVEDIFQCEMISGPDLYPVNPYYAFVDTTLYNSYDDNDLRKQTFFKARDNNYYFTGSYSGYYGLFAGLATDEMYLIRAECNARSGNETNALQDLNTLLESRYKKGKFMAYTLDNTPDVLALILKERRKELCFRGLRWSDLRRLNLEGANIVLHRNVEGVTYTLPPNDDRYVYPIPTPVINLNPSIEQNIR